MAETDPVLLFTRRFDSLGLEYMVTGSVAGVVYGEPRVTHDVDVVLLLPPADTPRLAAAFPLDSFYCPPEEVLLEEARRAQRGHFNLIHHDTGFRADVYLMTRDPLHRWAFGRRARIALTDGVITLAPLEYVILRKLEFFREGGSEKHLRDIESMLRVSGERLDRSAVEEWAARLGLGEQWRLVAPSVR